MIESHVIPQLKSKRAFSQSIFMQDGVTPHTARATLDFLKKHFGQRIISRSCEWFWPPRSPCDFWFWGYIKEKVYKKKLQNLNDLREAIVEEIRKITPEMLQNVINSIPSRIERLRNLNGQQLF